MKATELEAAADLWSRPPRAQRGDPDPRPVYEAVGFALSTWELLETNLSHLFTLFIDADSHAARRAYGSLPGQDARAEALRAAAEAFFAEWRPPQAEQEIFEQLMEHFARAAQKRHEIAHGIVMNVMEMGHFLVPPDYHSSRRSAFLDDDEYRRDTLARLRVQYRYTRNDIIEFSVRFGRLADAVIDYVFFLRRKYLRQ